MKVLTQRREALGFTRSDLGRVARIHPARVGQIELGRITPPVGSVELVRLAKALKWTGEPSTLLEEVDREGVR
ncbi:MAG: helix-turn-helix transcriptional regulator [Actinomycetes bacterium]